MKSGKQWQKWISLVGLIAFIQACSAAHSASETSVPQPVPVVLSTVERQTVRETSEFVATLRSRRSVAIRPQVEGRVVRILAANGQQVAAGAALLEIDPARQRTALAGAEAAIRAAEAERDSARAQIATLKAERREREANLQFARAQRDRYAALATEGAVSRQEADRYETAHTAAWAALTALDERIRSAGASLVRAGRALEQARAAASGERVQLNYFRVGAPFAGRVGDIPVRVGDYVTPQTELTTVTDNRQLELYLNVPVERATALTVGRSLELTDERGELLGTSRIAFVSPEVDERTQAVLVKAIVDNAAGHLRSEQFVRARLIWQSRPGLAVPASAVVRVGGQDFVFVAQDSPAGPVARQRPVTLADDLRKGRYPVLAGLAPGQRVVVSGVQKLSDGAPIAPGTR